MHSDCSHIEHVQPIFCFDLIIFLFWSVELRHYYTFEVLTLCNLCVISYSKKDFVPLYSNVACIMAVHTLLMFSRAEFSIFQIVACAASELVKRVLLR